MHRPSSSIALLLSLTTATTSYLLPNPPGPYNVTLTTGPLTDWNRTDPYAAIPTPRTLMLSVFQPATCSSTIPVAYMPPQTARVQGPYLQKNFNVSADLTDLFLDAQLPVCPPESCPAPSDGILLFSPAWGVPRLYFNVIASAIASKGFTVILIDHPEDANIITYPDGHLVYDNITTTIVGSVYWDEYPRAHDMSFLISSLRNATAMGELLPQRGARPFKTDRIGVLGQSLGGGAAILAASLDPRIRAAIDYDGTIQNNGSLPFPISQPVLLVEHDEPPAADGLKDFPTQFTGPKLWLRVKTALHQTFTDVPTLLQAAGVDAAPYVNLLGTIKPVEMVEIMMEYTAAWMRGAFDGEEGGPLLEGQEAGRFPEIETVMKGNF